MHNNHKKRITFKMSIFSFSLVGGLSDERKGIADSSPECPTISSYIKITLVYKTLFVKAMEILQIMHAYFVNNSLRVFKFCKL